MQQLDELDSSSHSLLFSSSSSFIDSYRITAICSASSIGIGWAASYSTSDSSRKSSISRIGLSENALQLEFVACGEYWKRESAAVRARREVEKLCGKERKM